jgi:hypothetical protein
MDSVLDLLQKAQATKALQYFNGETFDDTSHPTLLFLKALAERKTKDDSLSYDRFLHSLEVLLTQGPNGKHAKAMGDGIIEIKSHCGRKNLLRINCTYTQDRTLVILNHYVKERAYFNERNQSLRHGRKNESLIASSLKEAIQFKAKMDSHSS